MENILMFLTPKSECAYLDADSSLRQALEKMEYHRFQAIPVINKDGIYVKTLTEGDLLWTVKDKYNLCFKDSEDSKIDEIKPNRELEAIDCLASFDETVKGLLDTNFLPVKDDRGFFIGIITRKKVMDYLINKMQNKS